MPALPPAFLSIPERGVPLDELAARANAVLAQAGLEVADGRAATHIDARTVRFYQTIGVLPKPQYEGRRALYSLTHLLRLVAAKRLQAEGHSLAQIQAALPARTDAQLLRALSDLASLLAPPAVQPAAGNAPTQLRAFTLAKGVTLVIDPAAASVTDPDALAAALAAHVRASLPSPSPATRTRPSGGHR